MRWILLSLALAAPPADLPTETADGTQAREGSRMLAGLPLRIEHAKPDLGAEADKVGDTVNGLFDGLIDLQNELYGQIEEHRTRLGLTPGHRVRVRVDDRLFVHVEVVEREGDRARVRVKVDDSRDDAQPEAMKVAIASGSPGEGEGPPEARALAFAGPGEVVIEDLSVNEAHQLHVFFGDGEAIVIWIGEASP